VVNPSGIWTLTINGATLAIYLYTHLVKIIYLSQICIDPRMKIPT